MPATLGITVMSYCCLHNFHLSEAPISAIFEHIGILKFLYAPMHVSSRSSAQHHCYCTDSDSITRLSVCQQRLAVPISTLAQMPKQIRAHQDPCSGLDLDWQAFPGITRPLLPVQDCRQQHSTIQNSCQWSHCAFLKIQQILHDFPRPVLWTACESHCLLVGLLSVAQAMCLGWRRFFFLSCAPIRFWRISFCIPSQLLVHPSQPCMHCHDGLEPSEPH